MLEEMGTTIRTYRTRLGFTQNDLASALQVSPQAVSKWERGENAPDITLLPSLAQILGISTDTLLGAPFRERRTIDATVVFADMDGFAPLARDREPADLAIALNTFFYPLTEHMTAHDGVPIKYVGDELLCVFTGADHPHRAFRAAFAARVASPRPLKITLATGPVWMGPLGHPHHARPDVLGETVNQAAWLQGWTKTHAPGGVAALDSTVEPIRTLLDLGTSEMVSPWGSKVPLKVWEVVGLRP